MIQEKGGSKKQIARQSILQEEINNVNVVEIDESINNDISENKCAYDPDCDKVREFSNSKTQQDKTKTICPYKENCKNYQDYLLIEKKKTDIKQLAYYISHYKKENNQGIVVFLGAGASGTAGIPLGWQIIETIKKEFINNPKTEKYFSYCDSKKIDPDYFDVMDTLSKWDIKNLFTEYIQCSKVNIAHLYLANLFKNGFIDYVVTTNFDDLMIRALSFYNEIAPIYDLSLDSTNTTAHIDKKTIVYLHGRYNSLFQLNTKEEIDSIRNKFELLFRYLSDRPWLIIGYSGSEKETIFNVLKNTGHFQKQLYWVSYRDDINTNFKSKHIKNFLLNNQQTFWIQNNDGADNFIHELHKTIIKNHSSSDELNFVPSILSSPIAQLYKSLEEGIQYDDTNLSDKLPDSFKDTISRIKEYLKGLSEPETSSGSNNAKVFLQLLNEYNLAQRFENTDVEKTYDNYQQLSDKSNIEEEFNKYIEYCILSIKKYEFKDNKIKEIFDERRKKLLNEFINDSSFVKVEAGNYKIINKHNDKEANVKEFKISKYPVTQKLWKVVMSSNPSYFEGDDLPVEQVSWNDAQEFICRLNKITNKNYRLPTEREWEYAATSAGKYKNEYDYARNEKTKNLDDLGWCLENSDSRTHPIGQKQPNDLGLYDMSGNVWEWCEDKYDNNSANRVLRGGGWINFAGRCRVSHRDCGAPGYRGNDVGFRLVLPQ